MRKSQAENGADCQRKRPIDSSIFRNVCVVEILGVVLVADAHVQVAVDPVEMDQVQLLERRAVALLRARRRACGRAPSTRAAGFSVAPSSRVMPSPR